MNNTNNTTAEMTMLVYTKHCDSALVFLQRLLAVTFQADELYELLPGVTITMYHVAIAIKQASLTLMCMWL